MKRVVFVVFLAIIVIGCAVLFGYYKWGMKALDDNEALVVFIINAGETKTQIAKNLKEANLIRSEYVLDLYLALEKPSLQAGEYELSSSMTPEEIINKFVNGDIKINTVKVTLIEGYTLRDYADTIAENLGFTATEFIETLEDSDYLNELISEYWFLEEAILDSGIYYPLEGYLFPDTYEFLETATIDDVVRIILNNTDSQLESVRESINNSSYSTHEILTLASIVEKEANTYEDRQAAAQVLYKRLSLNMSLGSDVTTYYGVQKSMSESLTTSDLYSNNPYNTRLTDGTMNGKLPIGPINSPSLSAISAVLNPTDTNYLYFVANTCTGEVYFLEDYMSFLSKSTELKSVCESN